MSPNRKRYIFIAVAVLILAVTIYVIYALIKDGSPLVKSQNEYLVDANKLHSDSLFEEAVEPYMRAGKFSGQENLVNYNTAVNSIMKNYDLLSKSFNEEGYQMDSAVSLALDYAKIRLEKAAGDLSDTAKYSSAYHNIGVVNHMCNNLEAAAEAYKEALRKNPADEEARYNLAVILHQMKNNDQQQNQQEEKEQQNQPQQPQEDKEKMEQMLKALMQDEKEIREKMEEAEKAKAKRGIPEKNW